MLIKLLTEASKGRKNSSMKRNKCGGQRPTRVETPEFGATWQMLIKLLTEARRGRENSSTKLDKYGGQRPARAETTPSRGWVLTV